MLLHSGLALLLVLVTWGVARADAVLVTPGIRAGTGGALSCTALNVGTRPVDVVVTLVNYPPSPAGSGSAICNGLPSARTANSGAVCVRGFGGPTEAFCRVTVTGGSKSSVRAVLSALDPTGTAVNSVYAE
jgi:hypothetical protein